MKTSFSIALVAATAGYAAAQAPSWPGRSHGPPQYMPTHQPMPPPAYTPSPPPAYEPSPPPYDPTVTLTATRYHTAFTRCGNWSLGYNHSTPATSWAVPTDPPTYPTTTPCSTSIIIPDPTTSPCSTSTPSWTTTPCSTSIIIPDPTTSPCSSATPLPPPTYSWGSWTSEVQPPPVWTTSTSADPIMTTPCSTHSASTSWAATWTTSAIIPESVSSQSVASSWPIPSTSSTASQTTTGGPVVSTGAASSVKLVPGLMGAGAAFAIAAAFVF